MDIGQVGLYGGTGNKNTLCIGKCNILKNDFGISIDLFHVYKVFFQN